MVWPVKFSTFGNVVFFFPLLVILHVILLVYNSIIQHLQAPKHNTDGSKC